MATISFSGLASGIDSNSLIKSILDQKRNAQIKPLQTKISELQETNSAFSELSTLLSNLQSAASKFRAINGGSIAKNVSSSNESSVSGTAGNSATSGSYSINVATLASNATHSFNDRFLSADTAINANINDGSAEADRTVTYTIGSGSEQEEVSLVLTSTTKASDFVASFNASSEKATASLVNVGTSSSPSYAIVITSNNQGTERGSISVNVGTGVSDPNGDMITTDGAFVSSTSSAATDATFTVSGISGTITRSSNTVSDVIPGLTLNLNDTGSSVLTVSNNSSTTSANIQKFVDAYNEVINYIKENDEVRREEDGEEVTNVFGALSSSSLDESIVSALRSAMSAAGTSGRSVNILADLGITTERDGTLKFDTDVFEDAFASDPEGIRIITENLGEDLAAVNGRIATFVQFNGLIDMAETSNSTLITNSQNRIADLEKLLSKEEEALTSRFAKLEALIGRLNSQQSALASILPK